MKSPSTAIKLALKLIGATGVLILLVMWVAGSCRQRTEPGTIDAKPGAPLPANAQTITARMQTLHSQVELAGTAASERTIHLSSRIPSYVETVDVAAGQSVSRGDLLITLDDREIREQIRTADVQLRQAEADFRRAEALRATGATTAQAFDAAKAQFDAATAGHERLKVMLTYTRITAPIDGVITEKHIEAGDLASPGQVLLALYDPTRMRIEVPVPVRLIGLITTGTQLPVTIGTPAITTTGIVDEIISAIDPVTRTRLVKLALPEHAASLLPGTFGSALVPAQTHEALLIPADTITRAGQLEFVTVVIDGRAHRRLIKSGPRHQTQVELLSGLTPGDAVLIPAADKE